MSNQSRWGDTKAAVVVDRADMVPAESEGDGVYDVFACPYCGFLFEELEGVTVMIGYIDAEGAQKYACLDCIVDGFRRDGSP